MLWNKKRCERVDYSILVVLVFATIILLLNDRIWKYEYANWITGKLSDFFGLLALPIFIALVFPFSKKIIAPLIGVLFIFWKHPYAEGLISFWNSLGFFKVARVVDYSDYWAIPMLFIAHYLVNRHDLIAIRKGFINSTNGIVQAAAIVLFSLTFCSTSMMDPSYPKGDILIEEIFSVDGYLEGEIVAHFEQMGLVVVKDSIQFYMDDRVFFESRSTKRVCYKIEEFVFTRNGSQDTLDDIHFDINNTRSGVNIHIINCSVKNGWDLQNWKTLKSKTKIYRKIIAEELVKSISEPKK